MKVGGEAIAAGGFGCVFRPALKCKEKTHRTDGVSKLMKKKYAIEEEKELKKFLPVLKKIPNYKDYFLVDGISICSPSDLTTDDKKNFYICSNLGSITSANVNEKLDELKILNLPDGGIDLTTFLDQQINISELIKVNDNMINLLDNGISEMNDLFLIHNDLKADNIMIHKNNLLPKIIDWGLSSYAYFPNNNLVRPIQFNLPFSCIIPEDKLQDLVIFQAKPNEQDLLETNRSDLCKAYSLLKIFRDGITGHYHYLKSYIIPLINKTLNKKYDIDTLIQNYIYETVLAFSAIIDNKLIFRTKDYIKQIYRFNADRWGFIMAYLPYLSKNLQLISNKSYSELVNKKTEIKKIVALLIEDALTTPTLVLSNTYIKNKIIEINKLLQTLNPEDPIKTKTPVVSLVQPSNQIVVQQQKKKRCPKGTRRNKKTGNCEPLKKTNHGKRPRCPNGTRRNKKTGNCEPV